MNRDSFESAGVQSPSEDDKKFGKEVQIDVLSGEMPPIREPITGWKKAKLYIAAGVGAAASLIMACGTQPRSIENTPTPPVATAPATIPSSELTPGSKLPIVTKDTEFPPKETPTPVEVVKIPCGIVSPELCTSAKRLEETNAFGGITTYIALSLPENTELNSPIDGQMVKVELKDAPYKGYEVSIRNSDIAFYIDGDLNFEDNMLGGAITAGKFLTKVGNEGITNRGNYNILIRASRFDAIIGRAISAIDKLKEMFPAAFQKPAEQVQNPEPGKQHFGGNVFPNDKF
ncbi:MAG: hypothetical protein Q7R49_06990 [Candidatus Daviesbacteria bacterium]|nr:hypothetical protein [Candidatus Daviesbacteria bacterium]